MSIKNLEDSGQLTVDGTYNGVTLRGGRAYSQTINPPIANNELVNKQYVDTLTGSVWTKSGTDIIPSTAGDVAKINLKADTISEITTNNGVFIDGVQCKDGKVYSSITPTTNNELANKLYVDTNAGIWTRTPGLISTTNVNDDISLKGLSMDLMNKDKYSFGILDYVTMNITTNVSSFDLTVASSITTRYIDNAGAPKYKVFIGTPTINIATLNQLYFVVFNAVTELLETSTSPTLIDYQYKVPIGTFIAYEYLSTGINWNPHASIKYQNTDIKPSQSAIRERFFHYDNIGGVITTPGTNKVDITASQFGFGLENFDVSGLSSGAFTSAYYNGTTWVYTRTNIWDNLNYNNIATGLVTISSSNRYSYFDVYLVMNGLNTGRYYLIYGQAQDIAETVVRNAATGIVPTLISDNRFGAFRLGRFTFLKSATSATTVVSYLSTTGPTGIVVSSHSNLANLSNDDHSQYPNNTGVRGLDIQKFGSITGSTFNIVGDNANGLSFKNSTTDAFRGVASMIKSNSDISICSTIVSDTKLYNNLGCYLEGGVRKGSVPAGEGVFLWAYQPGYVTLESYYSNGIGNAVSSQISTVFIDRTKFYSPIIYSNPVSATNRAVYVGSDGALGYLSSLREHKELITIPTNIEDIVDRFPVKAYVRKVLVNGEYVNNNNEDTRYIELGTIAEELEKEEYYTLFQNLLVYDDIANMNKHPNDPLVTPIWKLATVKYDQLVVPLVYTIQKMKERTKTSDMRISTLENQVASLTTRLNDQDVLMANLTSRLLALEAN